MEQQDDKYQWVVGMQVTATSPQGKKARIGTVVHLTRTQVVVKFNEDREQKFWRRTGHKMVDQYQYISIRPATRQDLEQAKRARLNKAIDDLYPARQQLSNYRLSVLLEFVQDLIKAQEAEGKEEETT